MLEVARLQWKARQGAFIYNVRSTYSCIVLGSVSLPFNFLFLSEMH